MNSTDEDIIKICAEINAISDARKFMGFHSDMGEVIPDSRFNFTAESLNYLYRSNENLPPERIKTYQKPEEVKKFFMRLTKFKNVSEDDINNMLGQYFEGFPEAVFTKKIDVENTITGTRKQRATQFLYEFKQLEKEYNNKYLSSGVNYGYFLSEVFFDAPKTEVQIQNLTAYYVYVNSNIRNFNFSLDF